MAASEGIEVREVDAFDDGLIEALTDCDGFMWCFPNFPEHSDLGKHLSLAISHGLGLPMFPDWRTCWFFEDKHAQKYLLEAARVPMPRSWVFREETSAMKFLASAEYPLVVKLAYGIVSANVRLLNDHREAEQLVKVLFHHGLTRLPKKLWSGGPVEGLRLRASNVTRAALGRRQSGHQGRGPIQRNAILFQEFLSGNKLDYRITVIGKRAFGFRRFNRQGDFRASGSGSIDWNPEAIEREVVELAFHAAEALGSQVLALDILRREEELVVVEISYYYEAWAVHRCPGHWRQQDDGQEFGWVDGPLRPEDAIFRDFVDFIKIEHRTPNAKRRVIGAKLR